VIATIALDIVQGAMLRLARSYGQRPSEEWKPLFYRILYNGIRDWQRRSAVRSRIFSIWPSGSRGDDEEPTDPYEHVADNLPEPSQRLMADEAMHRLESAVAACRRDSARRSCCAVSKAWTSRRPRPPWAVRKGV
jgi:RNA polymerase sigma-70 factor (ECF subfamily)